MTHERHEENAAAYVLGALPDIEQRAFERHLESCEDCSREVERLRPAADALSRAPTPLTPPPGLKASLMQVVEREASEVERRQPAAPKRRLAFLRPAWVTAVVLVAVGAAAGFGVAQQLGDDGGSRTLAAEVDETRIPRGTARLVVSDDGQAAVLRTNAMPSLGEGAVYQVWLQRDGEVISQSLFEVRADGQGAGAVTDGLDGADAVLVTREPAGGSRTPTEKPVISVEL